MAVALVAGLQLVAAPTLLRVAGAGALVLFGLFKLLRPGAHPRWVGMRVTPRDLVVWSFLMSSAHGAGLMLFPLLLGLAAAGHAHDLPSLDGGLIVGAAAAMAHTLAMLVVMGAIAVVVYEKVGLDVLRRAWINLDAIWAGALAAAGLATLFT